MGGGQNRKKIVWGQKMGYQKMKCLQNELDKFKIKRLLVRTDAEEFSEVLKSIFALRGKVLAKPERVKWRPQVDDDVGLMKTFSRKIKKTSTFTLSVT